MVGAPAWEGGPRGRDLLDRICAGAAAHLRPGDIFKFDGYLVEADGQNGYKWVSSLTRSDSGAGACEVVWVEHFGVAPR